MTRHVDYCVGEGCGGCAPARVAWYDEAPGPYADQAPCGRCAKDVALDHDPPCGHGYVACPECGHEAVCIDCRLLAEVEMHTSGNYNPKADPLYDHTAPKPIDRIERDGGYHWEGSWIDVPRKDESA